MADEFDMRGHRDTWEKFTRMVTFSAVGVILVLVLMALFLL